MNGRLRDFLAATAEGLAILDSELALLERRPDDPARLRNIYRIIHTIKDACVFLGLERLETVTRALEKVLERYCDGDEPLPQDAITLILESLSVVTLILAALAETEVEPEGDDAGLIVRLDAAANARHSARRNVAEGDLDEADGAVVTRLERRHGRPGARPGEARAGGTDQLGVYSADTWVVRPTDDTGAVDYGNWSRQTQVDVADRGRPPAAAEPAVVDKEERAEAAPELRLDGDGGLVDVTADEPSPRPVHNDGLPSAEARDVVLFDARRADMPNLADAGRALDLYVPDDLPETLPGTAEPRPAEAPLPATIPDWETVRQVKRRAKKPSRRKWRSLVNKLCALVAVFLAVPIILYAQFKSADDEKRSLLLKLAQEQGRLIAQSLRPLLEQQDSKSIPELNSRLSQFGDGRLRIKVLFRPAGNADSRNFFYVASFPVVPNIYLKEERAELIETGILDKLLTTCEGNSPLAVRYINPAGEREVLTSVTPVNAKSGCWVVITSDPTADIFGASIGEPYWMNSEIQIAAAIYMLMAILVISLFLGIWRSLRRFAKLARDIRTDHAGAASFAALNEVPELRGVAKEFDGLVNSLKSSAESIRHAAEDNAHAFKTPIAIIRQSLEPLKRIAFSGDGRGQRSIELIETSVIRLDALVSAARQMDETNAELIDPPRQRINLSALLARILLGYSEAVWEQGVRLSHRLDEKVIVRASEELLETVIENLLDNAISFSPPGSEVTVSLTRKGRYAEMQVADEGPGVPPAYVDKVFERYFSSRPKSKADDDEQESHFGIGLWIVRRNVEAVGGTVLAQNLPDRGLCVRIELPLAQ